MTIRSLVVDNTAQYSSDNFPSPPPRQSLLFRYRLLDPSESYIYYEW